MVRPDRQAGFLDGQSNPTLASPYLDANLVWLFSTTDRADITEMDNHLFLSYCSIIINTR